MEMVVLTKLGQHIDLSMNRFQLMCFDAFFYTSGGSLFSSFIYFVGNPALHVKYFVIHRFDFDFLPGRLQFFETSFDPTVRHTLWTQVYQRGLTKNPSSFDCQ